jgi:hypothetical protein
MLHVNTNNHDFKLIDLIRLLNMNQWIGLRDNLQESPIFNGKINGFRFSLKPIHWMNEI